MSTNDLILLNQLLDQKLSEVGVGMSEADLFEIFCAEQALKDDDLSYDELVSGGIDGGGDGGIDSIFFFVNDVPFDDEMEIASLKRNVALRLVLVQAKVSPGFSETAIEKLISSARDLFDLNKSLNECKSVYKQSLLEKIDIFRSTYLHLTSKFPSVTFEYAYAAKAVEVHQNVNRKVPALEATIKNFFNPVSFSFRFLTASELLARARKSPPTTSYLSLAENPISTGEEGYVCLVKLSDYFKFISDESSHLRSHLFEGNVRDYQGKTEVNNEIRATLDSPGNEDFWWLNNGVSIICSKAQVSGKILIIEDAEIVNGLQSSREIHHALSGKDLAKEPRNLLVRVLKPIGQESRDRIIKATNSQTPIPPASLRATDKIHRDIEDYLYAKGYYYDRRKNYYKNLGKPIKRILGIPYLAQCVMACALSDPNNARARPSSLIKNEDTYKKLFNSDYPLDLYLKCPVIVRGVEDALLQSGNDDYRRHMSNILFYVASLWILRQINLPQPSIEQVAAINTANMSNASVFDAAATVWHEYVALGASDQVAKGTELNMRLLKGHREKVTQALKAAAAPPL